MSKEPEIIYLTGNEKLQDKIAEITGNDKDKKVYVFVMENYCNPDDKDTRLTRELDSKKADEEIDTKILNTIVYIVNKRPELVKKILQGKIKMREGGSAKR